MPALAAALPPENTELPAISPHEPWEDVEAIASKGGWRNNPTSYETKWLRCNTTGGGCERIKSAKITESRYQVLAVDVGHTLRVEVTATNSSGSTTATSEPVVVQTPGGGVTFYGKPEHTPNSLVAGPDGNVWFTSADGHVGKISPAGVVTNVATLPAGSDPTNIAAGLEGEQALWFTTFDGSKYNLEKITTAGAVSEVALGGEPDHIAAQGKTNMWVTEPNQGEVAQISPTGVVTQRHLAAGASAFEIAYGKGEGVMWATASSGASEKLVRLTSTGEVSEFPDPVAGELELRLQGLDTGYNGYVWFLDGTARVGTIRGPEGAIAEYKLPEGITATQLVGGADFRSWFNDAGFSKFGSMTKGGAFTLYWHESTAPVLMAATPDGHVWFVNTEGVIGKFSV
jgi:streptogramin lyase